MTQTQLKTRLNTLKRLQTQCFNKIFLYMYGSINDKQLSCYTDIYTRLGCKIGETETMLGSK